MTFNPTHLNRVAIWNQHDTIDVPAKAFRNFNGDCFSALPGRNHEVSGKLGI